ncbi:hydroxysqualene dehydroxylase HpnE [Rhodoferax sediminis]|uniref:Desaturase n=1 Tax=Rhodoferax sediminis TaxID=2509614 RepID=A0A515DA50_9BURK|nr:hydroxysqualene dehydroxylase HpnE [Rhodoferax sediminis]QDL37280.1 desaturase [Rhodoferax sediminis]
MKVAIIGGGWAGMAAAVTATRGGHHAIVFEASRVLGGRARGLNGTLPDGTPVTLDNGQHILIGAYSETLRLMQLVGVDPDVALARLPLALRFPDGSGLALRHGPAPWDALAGIVSTRGWGWRDKLALLRSAIGWRLGGFRCAPGASVAQLCAALTPRLQREFIEPLCVAALNTPAEQASGQVFLRVIRDSLFAGRGGSNLLLPRVDLAALFPDAAARWLQARGGEVRMGQRVQTLRCNLAPAEPSALARWHVNEEAFDRVILATSASDAAAVLAASSVVAPETIAAQFRRWAGVARALRFEAITTVYALATTSASSSAGLLHCPMLALRSSLDPARAAPAQFVFDRGQLGGPANLLAFVVSTSNGNRDDLQAQVVAQARSQLGLRVAPIRTIVEKRATFACTPGLRRPPPQIAPGLLACGDYIEGPYPATLEGATRSGVAAAQFL